MYHHSHGKILHVPPHSRAFSVVILACICSWGWLSLLSYIQLQLFLALDLQLVGKWTWHLALQLDQKMHEGKKIACRFYMALFFHTFFKDNSFRSYFCCRSYSFCRSYSKVSLLSAKKYAHKLITELYTAIQNLQLAFADGSTEAALCISQCMDRMFLNSSFLLLLISKFCSHCMSFNTFLSSKWFYFNSPGNIYLTWRS